MASDGQLDGWLKQARTNWAALAQASAWVMGIMSSFLLPPPVSVSKDDEKIWLRLAQFVIAVLIGLLFVAARRWNKRRHVRWWATSAAVMFLLSILLFVFYQYLSLSLTCKYYSQTIVIGSSYTTQGANYAQKNPGISCEKLLKDFTGQAEDVWTKESVTRNRVTLAVAYIGSIPFFVACIMGVVQALSITGKEGTRRRSPPPRVNTAEG
jgi:uncharacterized membrane protein YhaH (DUF805 family)